LWESIKRRYEISLFNEDRRRSRNPTKSREMRELTKENERREEMKIRTNFKSIHAPFSYWIIGEALLKLEKSVIESKQHTKK